MITAIPPPAPPAMEAEHSAATPPAKEAEPKAATPSEPAADAPKPVPEGGLIPCLSMSRPLTVAVEPPPPEPAKETEHPATTPPVPPPAPAMEAPKPVPEGEMIDCTSTSIHSLMILVVTPPTAPAMEAEHHADAVPAVVTKEGDILKIVPAVPPPVSVVTPPAAEKPKPEPEGDLRPACQHRFTH